MARIAFLTEIISPYRVPFLNAFYSLAAARKHLFKAFFLRQSESRRSWEIEKENISFPFAVARSLLLQRTDGEPRYFSFGLLRELKKFNPDIIITGGFHQLFYWRALLWARGGGKKAFLFCESFKRPGPDIFLALKKLYVRLCDGYIAPGSYSKQYLLSLGAKNSGITVVPNAVDNDYFINEKERLKGSKALLAKSLGLHGKILFYAGRIVKEKGIDRLFKAHENISKSYAPLELVLAGSSAQLERYKKAFGAKRSGNIHFTGSLSRKELARYYAAADIFVFPTQYDPWGMVVNEAMLSGVPVAASVKSQAAQELIIDGENGFLFSNDKEMEDKITALLKDEKLSENFSRKAYMAASRITANEMAEGFLKAVTG